MTTNSKELLRELVELSRWLGATEQDCAILGEGNTSARFTENTFLVKASGFQLGTLDESGLIEVDLERGLALLEANSDEAVETGLQQAKVDRTDSRKPSVETSLHAACLSYEGVQFVGHCHPTAVNAIACSNHFESLGSERLFPDEVVVCGARAVLVPYVDPGVELARVVKQQIDGYVREHGAPPKTIYLRNHGLIALGATAKQVRAITEMAVKAARIRLGALSIGGFQAMSEVDVNRIASRSDEHYRQRIIEQSSRSS